MTDRDGPFLRWKPAILGLLLGLAALLHGFPSPASVDPIASVLLSDPHALCLSLTGDPVDGQLPSTHHDCDECCLPGAAGAPLPTGTVAFVVPPAVWATFVPAEPNPAISAAPPWEAWAPGRAQRGPPKTSIA